VASALIATDALEAQVQSGLPAAQLETVIDALDAEIVRRFGPHDGERTVMLRPASMRYLYLPRPALAISEVVEWTLGGVDGGAEVGSADYQLVYGGRALCRTVGYWRLNVAVTYTPTPEDARRALVLIDLCKWELAQRGLTREHVGSYIAYTANAGARERIFHRLDQRYGGGGMLA